MATPFKSGQKIKATGNIRGCKGLTQNKEYVVERCYRCSYMKDFMVIIITDDGDRGEYMAYRFTAASENVNPKFKVGDTILVKYYTGYYEYKVLSISDDGNAVKTDKNDWINIGPDNQYKFIQVL